jgi:hypothetical protein
MVGRSLGPVGNQLPMNVQLALAADSKTRVSISDRHTSPAASSFTGPTGRPPRPSWHPSLFRRWARKTCALRMELGLGIWTAKTYRYYPVSVIR